MIQIQPTRFHYNWQKKGEDYPSYGQGVRREFDHYWELFSRFVAEENLGTLALTQWEVTYIDFVPPGELWETPADWHRVLPGLLGGWRGSTGTRLESIGGQWSYEIHPQRGRVYVQVNPGTVTAFGDQTGLVVQTTARGPVSRGQDFGSGLDVGHDVCLEAFLAVTSPDAHRVWGREDE